jgi:hypothetical protein
MKEVKVDNKPIKIDPKEKVLIELINGRKPANAYEEQIAAQIEEMKKKGEVPYIPSNL